MEPQSYLQKYSQPAEGSSDQDLLLSTLPKDRVVWNISISGKYVTIMPYPILIVKNERILAFALDQKLFVEVK